MSVNFEYANSMDVRNAEDCYFYHSMSIPGYGEVTGSWDLRSCIHQYLGNFDFSNKRALDVGTASGFLTFEMERYGADVVSFDMNDGAQWDIVPHFKVQHKIGNMLEASRQWHEKLKNSYWFTHKRVKSNAKVYYGDVYDLPDGLGKFDVVVLGMILSHLRDPFKALYSASRLASDTMIVTNQPFKPIINEGSIALFAPKPGDESILQTWWIFSPECITNMLGVLGFRVEHTVDFQSECLTEGRRGYEKCTAFVAKRSDEPFVTKKSTGLRRVIQSGFIKLVRTYQSYQKK